VLCAFAVACAEEGGHRLVKVGVINSVTGPEAPIGETLANGIALAEEDLAKAGIKVSSVREDDTGRTQIAMSGAEKLATRDQVAGIVGPYTSSAANAVARLAERYQVPMLVPTAFKEEVTRQGLKNVFRISGCEPPGQQAARNHAGSVRRAQITSIPITIGSRCLPACDGSCERST
jgi:branched-chain amino acid transport system substrate-binding protein